VNLICSAGKGELTKKECLQCALDGDNLCGYSYGLLKSIYTDNVRTGIHVSDIVNCLRMAWYNQEYPDMPQMPHMRSYLTVGTAIHHHLEFEDDNMKSEIPVEAFGIVGTVDAYFPETGTVLDYKTTRWLTPSKLPYGHAVQQINIYALLMSEMGYEVNDLYLQYIDVSGPTKCRQCKLPVIITEGGNILCPKCGNAPNNAHLGAVNYHVPIFDLDETREFVEERRQILEAAIQAGEPPERETGFLCYYCEFADICQPFGEEEI
jgi:CRISPR/Cas system-associated exonuclease Cas4 (RecB family)